MLWKPAVNLLVRMRVGGLSKVGILCTKHSTLEPLLYCGEGIQSLTHGTQPTAMLEQRGRQVWVAQGFRAPGVGDKNSPHNMYHHVPPLTLVGAHQAALDTRTWVNQSNLGMRTRANQATPQENTHRSLAQGFLHLGKVLHGTPDLSNEALLGDIQAALVEDEVDGLHLLHLHLPGGQCQHHLVQHLCQVLLCLLQHLWAPKRGSGIWSPGVASLSPSSRCPAHHTEVLDLADQPIQRVSPAGLALWVGVHMAVEAGIDGHCHVEGWCSLVLQRVSLNKAFFACPNDVGLLTHQSEILWIFCPICSPQ